MSTPEQRKMFVVKSNDLIQESQYALPIQQQRLLLYAISKIKPRDTGNEEYTISVKEFCEVAGLEVDNSGFYYKQLRTELKQLRDSSVWVKTPDGGEFTLSWLSYVHMDKGTGNVSFKFSETIQPHLFDLRERYTQYRLSDVLVLKSKYSIRLYELIRSYINSTDIANGQACEIAIETETLKRSMGVIYKAEDGKTEMVKYTKYADFKKNALDKAVNEINEYNSDLHISYLQEKEGAKIARIVFVVEGKRAYDELMAKKKSRERLR